ncbi:hypothetical protein MferCBS31731_000781 [Microsporum ferrugineum]
MNNGPGNSSSHQSLEDMPMPGNFPNTPDVDDLDDLHGRLNNISLDTSFNGNSRGTQLHESTYEGWTLYRGEPKVPGGERSWATATICKMPLPQAELIDLVQKQKRQSVTEAYHELTLIKRQHIDNLIEERKQECNDPKYDWICVYINSATRDIRSTFGPKKALTISIAIVLCKQLKPEVLRALRTAQIQKQKKARNTARQDGAEFGEFGDPFRQAHHQLGLGVNLTNPQQDPRPHSQSRTQPNFQNEPPQHLQDRPPVYHQQLPSNYPQGHPHPHHGDHQFNHPHAHSAGPPQGQRHVNQLPPAHHDPRMMTERPIPQGPPPDHGQMAPVDEFRAAPHHQEQRVQPEMIQITPGHHHHQGQGPQLEMMRIPPPPIGPHHPQPRPPPPQESHPVPQHEQLRQNAHPSERKEIIPGTQAFSQDPRNPYQHHNHTGNEQPHRNIQFMNQGHQQQVPQQQIPQQQMPQQILQQQIPQQQVPQQQIPQQQIPQQQVPQQQVPQQEIPQKHIPQQYYSHRPRHGNEELPPDTQVLIQGQQHPRQDHPRQEPPPQDARILNKPLHKPRKQKQLPPKVVNSEKIRRDQAIVEKWLQEESDASDYNSYLFDPENASSVTEASFSSGEYDKCDFSPDDEFQCLRSPKNHSREKSKSSDRNGYQKYRHSLGYRTHKRPSEKSYLAELPGQHGSRYRTESIEILPSNSMHNRSGKLTRPESVSYPSRHQTLNSHQRIPRPYSPGSPHARTSRSEIEWELEQEKERIYRRHLESQRSIEREVEARLLAESLNRSNPEQSDAQLGVYTPQRVLDTYEKYDRMKRLDGNRRQSYVEQSHLSSYTKNYPSSHHERLFRG